MASNNALALLIASLSPVTWLRLNDNSTSSSAVADSATSPAAGTLYSAINGVALSTVATSTRSNPGLVTGDSDPCFNFGGNTALDSPNRFFSNPTGWTVFCIVQPVSAPSGGVAICFQLTSNPLGNGEPEFGITDVGSGKFRLRCLMSGVSEIGMVNAHPTWNYGARLAVVIKKEVNGVVKEFVNGALVNTSTSAPGFNYSGGVLRWGYGRFQTGAASNYYQFPGLMDELALFVTPLSDATCSLLTTTA